MDNKEVIIIGGGLAGVEAAWQVLKKGFKATIFEMKPKRFSPAHSMPRLAEIVCSNSLKSMRLDTASGLLKEEMKRFDSLVLKCAELSSVPAGSALAVDKEIFSKLIEEHLQKAGVNIVRDEVSEIPTGKPLIIATGPLTDGVFAENFKALLGGADNFYFYDAIAPVIYKDSINMDLAFKGSRYGKGTDDYINCPMTKEEYAIFYNELIEASGVELKTFEKKIPFFESCMPVEAMAKRGEKTLLFGPLKPVGFTDPKTERRPYALIQLRQENKEDTVYNMVGFQTNLTYGEQKRIFRLIPALKDAQFARLGSMHRNSFIDSPKCLNEFLELKSHNDIYVAGQLTGVEGYVESAAMGIVAGLNASLTMDGMDRLELPKTSVIGALINYITTFDGKNFQPVNANFGILPGRVKKIDREEYNIKSLKVFDEWCNKNLASLQGI